MRKVAKNAKIGREEMRRMPVSRKKAWLKSFAVRCPGLGVDVGVPG